MDNQPNLHDHLVRLRGSWSEGEFSGQIEEHLADRLTVSLSLVTNTLDDPIALGGVTITLMGDGFYFISRSRVGGGSELLASGKVDALESTQQYGREYAKLHMSGGRH